MCGLFGESGESVQNVGIPNQQNGTFKNVHRSVGMYVQPPNVLATATTNARLAGSCRRAGEVTRMRV